MAFTENLASFFDLEGFAINATLKLANSSTREIKAIFETPTQSVEIFDSSIEADSPRLTCKTTDLAGFKKGGEITVNSKLYIAERVSHDGTGVSYIFLK
jgi:hypothetical protein